MRGELRLPAKLAGGSVEGKEPRLAAVKGVDFAAAVAVGIDDEWTIALELRLELGRHCRSLRDPQHATLTRERKDARVVNTIEDLAPPIAVEVRQRRNRDEVRAAPELPAELTAMVEA